MPKGINKKILFLFFVIAALISFGSARPMRSEKVFQSSSPSFPKDFPNDCWYEVFTFYDPEDIKQFCRLRLVCKDFEKVLERIPLSFKIDSNNIDSITFSERSLIHKAKKLTITDCDGSSVKKVLKNLENLRKLTVGECRQFTGEGLQHLKELQELNVWSCAVFNEVWLQNLPKLKKFTMDSCSQFIGEGLQNLEELQELLVWIYPVFNEVWLKHLSKLQRLEIYWCNLFAGKGLQDLEDLQELVVCGCPAFEEVWLKYLSNLQRLEIGGNELSTG